MEKTLFKTKTVLLDDETYLNSNFVLDYYILSTDLHYAIGRFKKIYGIEVVKSYIDSTNNVITQISDVKCVTFDKDEIKNFAEILVNGTVTPISLKEIVTDYIKERDEADKEKNNCSKIEKGA